MKKKSSNPVGMIAVLSFCSLIVILSYLMRTISIPSTYGAVDVDIPVMATPFEDEAGHGERQGTKALPLAAKAEPRALMKNEKPLAQQDEGVSLTLGDHSPMVFLAEDKAFFGRLTAFTRKLSATHNKFAFDTKADQDYSRFAKTFGLWLTKLPRASRQKHTAAEPASHKVVVILPAQNVAMDKVIHLIAALKSRPEVDRVVLGGGLL